MCGICGILSFDGAAGDPEYAAAVRRMAGLMARRGPDAEGFWADPEGRLQLGFRRLAIIDLSAAANQPMHSADRRSLLVFNGEIYNFQDLRSELESKGLRFHTRSDSEVLLEALNLWNTPNALSRLNGMFAFAWYDLRERSLLLARDHAGIKPLYYFVHPAGKGLAFASQFDALLNTPWGLPGPVRLEALRLYLRLHHLPPPYGLLENTWQLEPGHYLKIYPDGRLEKRSWWRLPRQLEPDLHAAEALEALAAALDGAVQRQRIADVPLGVFLSGGVDSPLVSAVTRRKSGPGLRAYTIANPGWRQDESEDAARYAAHLDLDFHCHPVSGEAALEAIPEVIAAQHEPFADYSILPTLMVSRFARQELTVALSGDGGDELFFGYERPRSLLKNGADFRWPWPVRVGLYIAGKYGLGPRRSDVIVARTPGHYYFGVNCRITDTDLSLFAPGLPSLPADFNLYDYQSGYQGSALPRRLVDYSRYVEFYGQLQRGLKKVDMASMQHSLEVRVPLLDREVIETSLRIDPFESLRDGGRKVLLRDLLGRYVPAEMIPLSKRGFAVPLGEWLRGALRPLVEETLFSGDLYPAGLFERDGLRRYWQAHLSGERDHKWGLWSLLALQWWAYRTHVR